MGLRRIRHWKRSPLKVAVTKWDSQTSWLLMLFVLILLVATQRSRSEEGEGTCECPKLSCEPCFEEQGVTFYSEKCGPNQSRVKSCAKPTCVAIDPRPAQCARVEKPHEPVTQNEVPVRALASTKDLPASKAMMDRRLAEFKQELRGDEVGTVENVLGKSHLMLPSGEERVIQAGFRVHEKDQVKTTLRGHVKIRFDDGNEVHIKPNTQVVLQEYTIGKDKKVILDLIKGKVRSKVKENYGEGGESSYYRVKTKSAVAGVRGTDFVVEHVEDERMVTKVSTFEGEVIFGSHQQKEELASIGPGQQASFIVAGTLPTSSVFTDDEMKEFVAKGYMTPVYSLSAHEIKELKELTEVAAGDPRTIARAIAKPICASPKADLNQCMWQCQNNPSGEKRCRTDLPQVNCVRKKCDANGQWSDESRLPASFYDSCEASGFTVGPCDY